MHFFLNLVLVLGNGWAFLPLAFAFAPPSSLLLAPHHPQRETAVLQPHRGGYPTWLTTATSPCTTSSSSTALCMGMDPLASQGDWTAYLDDGNTGLVYYFNKKTGDSLWEPPTKTFPAVSLTGRTRRKARDKQLEYVKAMQEQQQQQQRQQQAAATPWTFINKETKKEEQEDWFGGLFEERVATQSQQQQQQQKVQQQEPKRGFFSSLLDGGGDKQQPSGSAVVTPAEPEIIATPEPLPKPVPTTVAPKEEGWFGAAVKKFNEQQQQVRDEIAAAADVIKEAPAKILTTTPVPAVEPIAKPIPTVDISTFVLPHPSKVFWGGEDAVFCVGRTFGVFDGVSGAFKLDGVPLYSKTLAKQMKQTVEKQKEQGLDVRQLTKLLTDAAEVADREATGASTAIVASIDQNGFLRVLNVGDSTCMVIRNSRVGGKTKEISHYFECPYQLSSDSPDRPSDGTKLNMELVKGDLIVMGSDGIFDNLSEDKILEAIQKGPQKCSSIAKRLSEESRRVSLNRQIVTPYSVLARKYGDPDYSDGIGGKVDDVSCIVARYE